MSLFLQNIYHPVCISCSSLLNTESLFCKFCFETEINHRLNNQNIFQINNANVKNYFLFQWKSSENDVLNNLIYALKGNRASCAWAVYAKIFFILHKNSVNFSTFKALVPIPSSRFKTCHAMLFANELSKLSGLPVLHVLQKSTGSKYKKHMSLAARKSTKQISAHKGIIEDFTKIMFVDDVLTTGSSFLESKAALNAHSSSVVLSLFYRLRSTHVNA